MWPSAICLFILPTQDMTHILGAGEVPTEISRLGTHIEFSLNAREALGG